jgi:YHS domain-containing protein/thiol-disulfide isomerase/thioredoxin
MSRRRLVRPPLVAIALISGFGASPEAARATGPWRTDFAAAQAEAERDQKPLLVHFYATWCLPCSKMDRDVLKSAEVKKRLDEQFVCVKVDSDQHPDLVQRFGIQMLPSDVFIDPTNGRVLLESQGSRDLRGYLALMSQADGKFQRAILASRSDPVAPVKTAPLQEERQPPLSIELGDPKPLVGLDGYSPVALTKHRKWVRGSANYAWDYQGITYHLASRQELLEFRADPERYAPRLLGCDPVILWETDRAVAGRMLYGAFYDDELYFFTSAENRRRFKANPQRFIKTQHVLKVDQIDRTALLDDAQRK